MWERTCVTLLIITNGVLKIGQLIKEHEERRAGCFSWVDNLYEIRVWKVCNRDCKYRMGKGKIIIILSSLTTNSHITDIVDHGKPESIPCDWTVANNFDNH